MKNDSYIKLDWETVQGLATQTIEHIHRVRQERDDEFIQSVVEEKNNSLFYRFLKLLGLWEGWTYEKAKYYVESEGDKRSLFTLYPSIYAHGDLKRAERLLDMTKHHKDIYLCSEDYRAIS